MQDVATYQPPHLVAKQTKLPVSSKAGMGRRFDKAYLTTLADDLTGWFAENQLKTKDIRHLLLKRYLSERGFTIEDVERFAKEHTYFARALALAKQWQEVLIIEHGLSESKGQTTAALVLKNDHNYKEKTESAHSETKTVRLVLQVPSKRKLKEAKKALGVLAGSKPSKKAIDADFEIVENKGVDANSSPAGASE